MRILRALLILACLLVFVLPSPALAATLPPDFYLPTIDELPSGVEIRQTTGPTAVGIKGGMEEQRIYSSTSPVAMLGVTVSVLDPQMAPQRYGSGVSAMLRQGYVISPQSDQPDRIGIDLVQIGPELTRRVRYILVGSVTVYVAVVFNNAIASDAEAGALADAAVAPTLTRMQARPDGV